MSAVVTPVIILLFQRSHFWLYGGRLAPARVWLVVVCRFHGGSVVQICGEMQIFSHPSPSWTEQKPPREVRQYLLFIRTGEVSMGDKCWSVRLASDDREELEH